MALRVVSEVYATVFTLPHFIARDEGYFAEEGLELVLESKPSPTVDLGHLIEDPRELTSFGGSSLFESGQASFYRACEWGQIRRSYDSVRGGRVIGKRAAVASQAIFVRPDSPISHPQDLAERTVGVAFHHGSHYIAIQSLEGFLRRDEIRVVHAGGPRDRFTALRDGHIDAAALMEPWITVAEKLGYKLITEAHYVGSEIAGADMDAETFAAINRAVAKGVRAFNADPRRYLHYLIDDIPRDIVELSPDDFRLSRLRYIEPAEYPEEEFLRTYEWMVGWGLVPDDASFEELVDNRVQVLA